MSTDPDARLRQDSDHLELLFVACQLANEGHSSLSSEAKSSPQHESQSLICFMFAMLATGLGRALVACGSHLFWTLNRALLG